MFYMYKSSSSHEGRLIMFSRGWGSYNWNSPFFFFFEQLEFPV